METSRSKALSSYVVSDFSKEYQFGIRHLPVGLRGLVPQSNGQLILYVPETIDIDKIEIVRSFIRISREDKSVHTISNRQKWKSLDDSLVSKVVKSHVLSERQKLIQGGNLWCSESNIGTSTVSEVHFMISKVPASRCLVLNFSYVPRKPIEIVISIMYPTHDVTIISFPIAWHGRSYPFIAFGTLWDDLFSTSSLVIEAYNGLLAHMISRVSKSSTYPVDMNTLAWFHGAIVVFVNNLGYFVESPMKCSIALGSLCSILHSSLLPHWAILEAVGHVLGVLGTISSSGRERWLEKRQMRDLWQLPYNILISSAESDNHQPTIHDSIGTRLALHYLCLDLNDAESFPSYFALSGALPLWNYISNSTRSSMAFDNGCTSPKFPAIIDVDGWWEAQEEKLKFAGLDFSAHYETIRQEFSSLVLPIKEREQLDYDLAIRIQFYSTIQSLWKACMQYVSEGHSDAEQLAAQFLRVESIPSFNGITKEGWKDRIKCEISGCITLLETSLSQERNLIERLLDHLSHLIPAAQAAFTKFHTTFKLFHDALVSFFPSNQTMYSAQLVRGSQLSVFNLERVILPNPKETLVAKLQQESSKDHAFGLLVSLSSVVDIKSPLNLKSLCSNGLTNDNEVFYGINHSHILMWGGKFSKPRGLFAGTHEVGFADRSRHSAQFNNPQALCYLPADGAGVEVLVCADTGNNCIRLIQCGKDSSITTIGNHSAAGYRDGEGSVALFARPNGVVALEDGSLIICDTGNNCLRSLKRQDSIWTVATVAGSPTNPGWLDGPANVARISYPTQATTDGSIVFFLEEGEIPRIRAFCSKEMSVYTIFEGYPLVAPSSICLDSESLLYICDPRANCVWALNCLSKQLSVKLSQENMFLHAVEMTDGDSGSDSFGISRKFIQKSGVDQPAPSPDFFPTVIVRSTPGCFIIADNFDPTHTSLYKYYERRVIETENRDYFDEVQEKIIARKENLKELSVQFQASKEEMVDAFRVCESIPRLLRSTLRAHSFSRQLEQLSALGNVLDASLKRQVLGSSLYFELLKKAPNLASIVSVIDIFNAFWPRVQQSMEGDIFGTCRIQHYLDSDGIETGREYMSEFSSDIIGSRHEKRRRQRTKSDFLRRENRDQVEFLSTPDVHLDPINCAMPDSLDRHLADFLVTLDFCAPGFDTCCDLLNLVSKLVAKSKYRCVQNILTNKTFRIALTPTTMQMLSLLTPNDLGSNFSDEPMSRYLRDAVLEWLVRIKVIKNCASGGGDPTFTEIIEALYLFKELRSDISRLYPAMDSDISESRSQEGASVLHIWQWLVHVVVMHMCALRVTVDFAFHRGNELYLEPICRDHLRSFLEALPQFCTQFDDMQSELVMICVSVSKELGISVALPMLFAAYPKSTSVSYSSLFLQVLDDLLIYAIGRLNLQQNNPGKLELSMSVLESFPVFWSKLLEWGEFCLKYKPPGWNSKLAVKIQNVCQTVALALEALAYDVVNGHASIGLLNVVVDTFPSMKEAWSLLKSPLSDESNDHYCLKLRDSMLSCWSNCRTLISIMQSLMPHSEELEFLTSFTENWDKNLMVCIRHVLQLPQPQDFDQCSHAHVEHFGPENLRRKIAAIQIRLPQELVLGIDWLVRVEMSSLFKAFWFHHGGCKTEDLLRILPKWANFLDQIESETVLFSTLDQYGTILLDDHEVSLFATTAGGLNISTTGDISFGFLTGPQCEIFESLIATCIFRWKHISDFLVNKDLVFKVLVASRELVRISEHHALNTAEASLVNLLSEISNCGELADQPYSNAQIYWPLAKNLDSRLLSVSHELLRAIQKNTELLQWLRSVKDDENFTSSLDIARSLQEMNAPMELWDNRAGRINEKYLSMISNIRDYLYQFLYNSEHQVESVEQFLAIFSSFDREKVPLIINNINVCSEVRLPLSAIIGVKTNFSGSSRLTRLYSEEFGSIWRCKMVPGSGFDGAVALRYQVDDTQGSKIWRQHVANDLIEFQSNLVLDRPVARSEDSDENEMVERFLTQCSLMRHLSELLISLHSIGHFDFYPEYCFDVLVTSPETLFREKAKQLEFIQEDWMRHVKTVRSDYYFINFFDIKRCYRLASLLNALQLAETRSDPASAEIKINFSHELKKFICFFNPDLAADISQAKLLAMNFLQEWVDYGSLCPIDSEIAFKFHEFAKFELLKVANIVEKIFGRIPRRVRPCIVDNIDRCVVVDRIGRGIHIAQGMTIQGVYDQVLTLYAIHQEFGEWENQLCCSKDTTLEQALIFIRRWHRAHQYSRQGVIYAMIDADKLSYEIQHSCVQFLREIGHGMVFSSGPLILIAESFENCYLTSQFTHNKITCGILPRDLLSIIGTILQRRGCDGEGIQCYTSNVPGAGKSFNVRMHAAQRCCLYSHIPINSQYTPHSVLIRRIEENIIRSFSSNDIHRTIAVESYKALHFDISSTAGTSIISAMFQLCVFGILIDDIDNLTYCYDPNKTVLYLELPAGLHQNRFSQFLVYPNRHSTVNSGSLIIDEHSLKMGMGEEFGALLYTPFVQSESFEEKDEIAVNAYVRLSIVLNCLRILRLNSGSFVESREESSSNCVFKSFDGSPAHALDLLLRPSGLIDSPSFWCLWSFVNVLYWLILQIQNPSSPVYLACLPDPGNQLMSLEFDTKMKSRVKGEMISFLIKTAREFATRNVTVKSYDANRVIGVLVRNCSLVPDSGGTNINDIFWARDNYDNDGKPVFRSPLVKLTQAVQRHYYLHYRESEQRWVIDDTVCYTGAILAYSTGDGDLEQLSFERRSLSGNMADISVTLKFTNKDKPGESVEIQGMEKCLVGPGTIASAEDNGIYYRMAPEHDIDGCPHYFKNDEYPRHLYFYRQSASGSGVNRWVIGKTCNVEIMGATAYARQHSALMDTTKFVFQYFRPNTPESKMKLELVTAKDAAFKLYGLAQLDSFTSGTMLSEETVDLIAAHLESANLGEEIPKWKDSNHECILSNNSTSTVCFLSVDPAELVKSMHPVLYRHLCGNHIIVGEDLRMQSDKHWTLLSNLTGVTRSGSEAMALVDDSFCLTGDSLLKIMAIVYRSRCRVPVVLLGECGCGKTMLLSFLCKWLGVALLNLDVHGGTTEEEIIQIFDKANIILSDSASAHSTVFVFLDEVNTCAHMGLLNEAICHRSIYGRRLHDSIQILVALNPYRLRRKKEEMGLTFNLGTNPLEDPNKKLVYKVHPIPPTLKDYIFDFGSLEPETEALYIHSMIANDKNISRLVGDCKNAGDYFSVIADIIGAGQDYVRKTEEDPSVVSLRDVKRTILLINWFACSFPESGVPFLPRLSELARAVILSVALVYCYRLPTAEQRAGLWTEITKAVVKRKSHLNDFQCLSAVDAARNLVAHVQKVFVGNLDIEEGLSMNDALSENLFVCVVCILNKIPIFIVGKPGTSKTLAIQVIASNLRGNKSVNPFWHDKPIVHIFQYQCSPLSTSNSIKYQFESAKSFQEHASNVLTVLLLDEVGLAENSPELPLKVLHYMLIDPPIAIVGLSNWALDSSKMNRAICLQRSEPSESDILFTGMSIVSSVGPMSTVSSAIAIPEPEIKHTGRQTKKRGRSPSVRNSPAPNNLTTSNNTWLTSLAKVYHELYTNQRVMLNLSRDFIGMRDYYCLLKLLRAETMRSALTPTILAKAVSRNFGGRPDTFPGVLLKFLEACFPSLSAEETNFNVFKLIPTSLSLIQDNLYSSVNGSTICPDTRHLMILSQSETVLQLLFGCQVVDQSHARVLIGSTFRDDLDELHLIEQIIRVKNAMAEGKTAILLNNDNIYESLYDLLNQRYVRQRDPETKREVRMLRLAMGSKSQLCPVHDNFKLIIIVQQTHAYEKLDLPLLNRFEKQVLSPADLLTPEALDIKNELQVWCSEILEESTLSSMTDVFCGFTAETLPSLVLAITGFSRDIHTFRVDDLITTGKKLLLRMASPLAVLYSNSLKLLINSTLGGGGTAFELYISSRSNLFSLLEFELVHNSFEMVNPGDSAIGKVVKTTSEDINLFQLIFLATRAPAFHIDISLTNWFNKLKRKMEISCSTDKLLPESFLQNLNENDVTTLQLACVTSERTVINTVEKFYRHRDAVSPKLLVISCDPIQCSSSAIAHVREIILQAYHVGLENRKPSDCPKIVIFVLHLPAGVHSRTREFKLDLYPPWRYYFLDELIDPIDAGHPDLMKLLMTPLSQLCSAPELCDVSSVLKKTFQTSMRYCAIPPLIDASDMRGQTSYVKMIKELLEEPAFMAYVTEAVRNCIRHTETQWQTRNGASISVHVYRAAESRKGSLRQSLQNVVETIIVHAFAHTLRLLDVNWSLSLLSYRMKSEPFLNLWLPMAQILLPADAIASACLEDLSVVPTQINVKNTGLCGGFACRFPFSDKIIFNLHNAISKSPGSLGNGILEKSRSLNSLLKAALSSGSASLLDQLFQTVLSTDRNAYLYDFVCSIVYPVPGISLPQQFDIAESFFVAAISCMRKRDFIYEFNPGMVHALYWLMETRLFHFYSGLSRLVCAHQLYRCQFLMPIEFDLQLNKCMEVSKSMSSRSNLKIFDASICKLLINLLQQTLSAVLQGSITDKHEFDQCLIKWQFLFSSVSGDLESLVTILLEATSLGSDDITESELSSYEAEVLEPLWLLKLANAMISAYGLRSFELESSFIVSLIESLERITCNPTSSRSLTLFLTLCSEPRFAFIAEELKYCYIKKFVAPEFEMLKRVGRQWKMSIDLLRLIANLSLPNIPPIDAIEDTKPVVTRKRKTNSMAGATAGQSVSVNEQSVHVSTPGPDGERNRGQLVLERSAIDMVYRAFTDPLNYSDTVTVFNEIILGTETRAFRFLQLLVERFIVDEAARVSRITSFETSVNPINLCHGLTSVGSVSALFRLFAIKVQQSLEENPIRHFARLRLFLQAFAKDLSREITDETSKTFIVPKYLVHYLAKYTRAQNFALKEMMSEGGKNCLVRFLRLVKPPFLPLKANTIDPSTPRFKALDPFSMFCDFSSYSDTCLAVMQSYRRNSIEPIVQWSQNFDSIYKKASWTDKMCLLVAAFHTQIETESAELSVGYVDSLEGWLRSDFSRGVAPATVNIYFAIIGSILKKQGFAKISTNLSRQALLENLHLHCTLLAAISSAGWLHDLLVKPGVLKTCLLPAMMDDEMSALMQFTNSSGVIEEVGWYSCVNGHRYAVGNCTMPMEVATCPECKAPIGGRNHASLESVIAFGRASQINESTSKRGYLASTTLSAAGYDIIRLGRPATVILRLLQHMIMFSSAALEPSTESLKKKGRHAVQSSIGELMYPDSRCPPETAIILADLATRIAHDWETLVGLLPINEDEVAIGLHIIINKLYFLGESQYSTDESKYGQALTDEEIARNLQAELNGDWASRPKGLKVLKLPPSNMSPAMRLEFEQRFERQFVTEIFLKEEARRIVQLEKAKFEDANIDELLKRSLGENYYEIIECFSPKDSLCIMLTSLWRHHDVITFDGFKHLFELQSSNAARYPIIAAVLANERFLPKICYIVDILAWQAIVFKVLKPRRLTREQTSLITNEDIIYMLPEDEQENARQCMQKFCHAFNESIILPGMLIGCTENKFKTSDVVPKADISTGTSLEPIPMHPGASIMFSLPSRATMEITDSSSGNRETGIGIHAEYKDPRSLCIGFILESLKGLQQTVVDAFLVVVNQRKQQRDEREAEIALPLALRQSAGAGAVRASSQEAVEMSVDDKFESRLSIMELGVDTTKQYQVPMTTYLTPSALVQRRLLSYNREDHLMPLIYSYAKQGLNLGAGAIVGYDFGRIEYDLIFALMPTIQPVAVVISEFTFSDEVIESGGIKFLSEKIKQEDLTASVLDQIMVEIDLDQRYTKLIRQLQDCIGFLLYYLSASGRMSGDIKLSTFVVEAMLIDTASWHEVSCPTIDKEVCLKHLKSLITGLDDRQHGGEFYNLPAMFKEPLTADQTDELLACLKRADDLSLLIQTLRDMLDILCGGPIATMPDLKSNLYEVGDGYELSKMSWYRDQFPASISIRAIFETYRTLKSMI